MHDVVADPRYAPVKKSLAARLEAELRQTADPRVLGSGDVFDSYPMRVFHERTLNGLTDFPAP
jgi:hypothetical protein